MATMTVPDRRRDEYAESLTQLVAEPRLADRGNATPLPRAIRAIDAPPQPPIEWLVEDLWTKGDIGLIVGDGGAFKSSAALHMAAAIAGGYSVFGRFRSQQRPVLIVSAEDSAGVILMRLEAFIVGQGWDRTRVLSNIHFFASDEVSLTNVRWQAHLLAEAKRLDAGFVILDPMAELIDGDENSNTDVRPVIKFVRSLTSATGASVAVVHHAGKAGPEKRTLDRIRGASALASAARVILFFEFKPEGVRVENLKMSRAERLEPFVLQRTIEHQQGNRAMWTAASLGYANAKRIERDRSETFVLSQLRLLHPERITTSRFRQIARVAPGIRNEDLGSALTRLTTAGLIEKLEGPRNAAMWGLTAVGLVADLDPARENWAGWATTDSDPAHPAQPYGQPAKNAALDPCVPLKGDGMVQSEPAHFGQGAEDYELELHVNDERGEAWEPDES
jgi:AAA domain